MFFQTLEVGNSGFESWMGAVEGVDCCCAFFNRGVQGWVKLDADGTMYKERESMLWNPMTGYKNMPG
eukprot:5180208-Ditylum_brightwellii.AAC.1